MTEFATGGAIGFVAGAVVAVAVPAVYRVIQKLITKLKQARDKGGDAAP